MKSRLAWMGAVLAATVVAAAPASAKDIHELLRKSFSADRRWTYQGTKVLTRRMEGEVGTTTAKVYHQYPDRTLVVGVEGPQRNARILQVGRQHYTKVAYGSYQRTPLPLPVDSSDLLMENYRIRQGRSEKIAGRQCVVVGLYPRFPGNPHKLVWLDIQRAFPLKTQIWSADGELTEESMFLTIQYNPRLNSGMFALPPTARRSEWAEVRPDFEILSVPQNSLPPGYRLVETSTRQVPNGGIVSFQRFCDGLNTLSVIESANHRDLESLGGRVAIRGKVGKVRYVICGEHAPGALRRIDHGLQRNTVSRRGGSP